MSWFLLFSTVAWCVFGFVNVVWPPEHDSSRWTAALCFAVASLYAFVGSLS